MQMMTLNAANEAKLYVDQFNRNHCYYRRVSICYYENLHKKQTQYISDFQILEECKLKFNGSLMDCTTKGTGCDTSCEEIVQATTKKWKKGSEKRKVKQEKLPE
uniref:Uncharacterized protein n=1 Tax=Romanomermis culicivorax TaxID=13658 RepID=A0A915L908_ROMCU